MPKDAVMLEARDLDDFNKTKGMWQTYGWLLSADYNDGMYSAIALKDSRVLLLLFREPQKEPEEPTQPVE